MKPCRDTGETPGSSVGEWEEAIVGLLPATVALIVVIVGVVWCVARDILYYSGARFPHHVTTASVANDLSTSPHQQSIGNVDMPFCCFCNQPGNKSGAPRGSTTTPAMTTVPDSFGRCRLSSCLNGSEKLEKLAVVTGSPSCTTDEAAGHTSSTTTSDTTSLRPSRGRSSPTQTASTDDSFQIFPERVDRDSGQVESSPLPSRQDCGTDINPRSILRRRTAQLPTSPADHSGPKVTLGQKFDDSGEMISI